MACRDTLNFRRGGAERSECLDSGSKLKGPTSNLAQMAKLGSGIDTGEEVYLGITQLRMLNSKDVGEAGATNTGSNNN